MYNLENDQSIVIKEGDKGSAAVIWDKKIALFVKKPVKKFQVNPLFSLKLFIILSKKFEKVEKFQVIF